MMYVCMFVGVFVLPVYVHTFSTITDSSPQTRLTRDGEPDCCLLFYEWDEGMSKLIHELQLTADNCSIELPYIILS